jgi:hypothetical protein
MVNNPDKQSNMPVVPPNAAGIDIGAKFHVVTLATVQSKLSWTH